MDGHFKQEMIKQVKALNEHLKSISEDMYQIRCRLQEQVETLEEIKDSIN